MTRLGRVFGPAAEGEETMRRRNRRGLRPALESVERRELLSSISAVMAANRFLPGGRRSHHIAQVGGGAGGGTGGASSPAPSYGSSITLGRATLTQGPALNPDGSINNMALAPTGTPTHRQQRLQQFKARFVGPFSVIPGQTTTQALQVRIQGGGTTNTMLHSDIQIRIVQPDDPSLPFGGVGTIFDRNINSNSALGFNITAPQQNVDRAGRPNHFPSVSVDINISAGTYVDSYGQGTMKIRYIPSGKHTPGVLSQGTAIVTVRMNIYAPDASYLLRNVGLNP